nr:tRNA sulfurtransferase [Klebsiella pneumoniae]
MQALVTGEALGQVSSQTLTNLRLIDNVSDTLILRPLISHDKEHIIDRRVRSARKISPAPCRNIAA